jgi:hypothetical protein
MRHDRVGVYRPAVSLCIDFEGPAVMPLPFVSPILATRVLLAGVVVFSAAFVPSSLPAEEPAATEVPVLGPREARQNVGREIAVKFEVKSAKDRLEKRGEIYLDADLDFRSEANFAVVVTRAGAASFQAQGISDIAEHFRDRLIRATGTVKIVDDVPRIEITNADQLQRVEAK